ncbi:hypothetical protein ACTXT7_008258 [Hymenolepis weldensis]
MAKTPPQSRRIAIPNILSRENVRDHSVSFSHYPSSSPSKDLEQARSKVVAPFQ